MYYWNINKIINAIKNNSFSELDKLKYYIFCSIFVLFIVFDEFDFKSETGYIKLFLMLLMVIIGSIYLYNKNNIIDGKFFIERITIFSVPITLRMIIVGFIYGLVSSIILISLGQEAVFYSSYFSIINTLIMPIISIYWQGLWFEKLASDDIENILQEPSIES